jgi:hypothetical protein
VECLQTWRGEAGTSLQMPPFPCLLCLNRLAGRQADRRRELAAHAFPSYREYWMTSGAIQCGVPMNVWRLDIVLVS